MLSESPKGFQVAGCGIRMSEAAAWAGWSHGAGFLASGVRSYSGGPNIFASGVVGGEKKMREAEV